MITRLLGPIGLGTAGLALLALPRCAKSPGLPVEARLRHLRRQLPGLGGPAPLPLSPPISRGDALRAARRLNGAAGILALAVLLDSAVEHYRGSFKNPAMYTPLGVSALTLAASLHGMADLHPARRARARDGISLVAAATGLVGTGFHIFNVLCRPGGLIWQNLFYGAPLGAPVAISLAGLVGLAAERVRNHRPSTVPGLFGLSAGRVLAGLSSLGILGTVGEAGLLHFRGAFHNPAMLLPVTMPPVAAVLLADAAVGPARRDRRLTRWWLRLTALLGFVGVGFHAWGVQRNMGGWRNWSQNLLVGPPLPAPPSFTGLALVGLAALELLEDEPDA